MFETKTNVSALGEPRTSKVQLVKFTRSLRGKTEEPGVYEGDAGDDGGRGTKGILERTRSLKSVFSRGRPRTSTVLTLVNQPGRDGPRGPSDRTGV